MVYRYQWNPVLGTINLKGESYVNIIDSSCIECFLVVVYIHRAEEVGQAEVLPILEVPPSTLTLLEAE